MASPPLGAASERVTEQAVEPGVGTVEGEQLPATGTAAAPRPAAVATKTAANHAYFTLLLIPMRLLPNHDRHGTPTDKAAQESRGRDTDRC